MVRQDTNIDVVICWCGSPATEYCKYNRDLHFSVMSIRKNTSWVRRIWIIVSDDFASPELLPANIHIVKESAFVPKKYLPVIWNSNVIESWIWRIPGLSECFVYMCDDMYIGRKISQDEFFIGQMPILRLYEGPPNYLPLSKTNSTIGYVRMWANAVEKWGLQYTRIQHQALPYRKSLMKRFYEEYKGEVHRASKNKLRSGEADFNLLRFSSSLAVMSGDSLLRVTRDNTDFFCESGDKAGLAQICKTRPKFFCINNTANENTAVYKMLERFFA